MTSFGAFALALIGYPRDVGFAEQIETVVVALDRVVRLRYGLVEIVLGVNDRRQDVGVVEDDAGCFFGSCGFGAELSKCDW